MSTLGCNDPQHVQGDPIMCMTCFGDEIRADEKQKCASELLHQDWQIQELIQDAYQRGATDEREKAARRMCDAWNAGPDLFSRLIDAVRGES